MYISKLEKVESLRTSICMIQDMLSQNVLHLAHRILSNIWTLNLSFLKHFASRYSLKIVQTEHCFIKMFIINKQLYFQLIIFFLLKFHNLMPINSYKPDYILQGGKLLKCISITHLYIFPKKDKF